LRRLADDTLCRVYVNDIPIGEGRNTHIHYAFDVTDAVHTGENAEVSLSPLPVMAFPGLPVRG